MKIAVTGHRPDKLGGYDENNPLAIVVKKHIRKVLSFYKDKELITICGMALGIDQWWAEACIELKIPFIAAVPFKGMESKWPEESQKRFYKILGSAKKVEYVCKPGYGAWKMQVRNEWMVNQSDLLIAYWNGSEGGTGNCVEYAISIGHNIETYNPQSLSSEE